MTVLAVDVIDHAIAKARHAGYVDGEVCVSLRETDVGDLLIHVFRRWRRWRVWEHRHMVSLFQLQSARNPDYVITTEIARLIRSVSDAVRCDCAMVRAGVCALWEPWS